MNLRKNPMKTFTYNSELYIRLIPGKALFNSTMIHEIVNRGDVLAMKVSDQSIRIIPGKAPVEHSEHLLAAEPNKQYAYARDLSRLKARNIVAQARLQDKLAELTALIKELS